jgi:hypothetical protein
MKRLAVLLLPLVLFTAISSALVCPTEAYADFSIYVGYAGGPYYKKTVYTDSDMTAMSSNTLYAYSGLDKKPSIRKAYGRGVILSDLFTRTGINTGALWRFYFSTTDGYVVDDGGEGYNAWYYDQLCSNRFYYPNLFAGTVIEDGEVYCDPDVVYNDAVVVPTILAYQSDYHRAETQDEWNSCELKNEAYRLLFGQTDPAVGNAHASAQNITAMTCIFEGTPTISFGDQTKIEGEVGDVVTVTPTITAADTLIEQYGVYDLKWSIDDSEVAEFVKDADGNLVLDENGGVQIRLKTDGKVTLSASYGDSPFSKYVAQASISGGSGDGDGKGDGSGDGDGKGDAEGDGKGDGKADSDGGSGSGSGSSDTAGGDGKGEGGNSGSDNTSIVAGAGDAAAPAATAASGEASEGSAQDSVSAQSSKEGGGSSSDNAEATQLEIRSRAQSKAWVVDSGSGEQNAMVDDPLLIAQPAALAVVLFGLFVVGVIVRVIVCERAKDPYVNERLRKRRESTPSGAT